MGLIEARIVPSDWRQWVRSSDVRNYVLHDPLLDWLDEYGEERGYVSDQLLPQFDRRTDFSLFIRSQSSLFRSAVIAHLAQFADVRTLDCTEDLVRSGVGLSQTFDAMNAGAEVICGGVLWDPRSMTYGTPDLLVRADVLSRLFPGAVHEEEQPISAPDLDGDWHYCVILIRFTGLHLLSNGELDNSGSHPVQKCEAYICNRALGVLQGYEPERAFVLGRNAKIRGEQVTDNCMEYLAPVSGRTDLARGESVRTVVEDACRWLRYVRSAGRNWQLTPMPDHPELFPNMGNAEDAPWHDAKKQIAEEIGELTQLWWVGVAAREQLHARDIKSWRDLVTAKEAIRDLPFFGSHRTDALTTILAVNRQDAISAILPDRISRVDSVWRDTSFLDFFVDFETVSDLADDFSKLPLRGGTPLIFMVGCGHLENGAWEYQCFLADSISCGAERAMLAQWLSHMQDVEMRLGKHGLSRLIHWSHHERSSLESAMTTRHAECDWESPPWFDFLSRVVQQEPVAVRGAFAFGLKALGRAFYQQGFISTSWGDGPADGLGAMVGAWWSYQEAERAHRPVSSIDLMQEIVAYNEVDCRVMYEIVEYLRSEH